MLRIKKWVPGWAPLTSIVMAVFTVWLRLAVVQHAYQMDTLEKEWIKLQRQQQTLQGQLASLRSPSRLKAMAKKIFNLTPPSPVGIIRISYHVAP